MSLHGAAFPGRTAIHVPSTAPLFIVLNRGSGKHGEGDARLTIEAVLTDAGRAFSVHEVEDPSQLDTFAAKAKRW